MAVVRLGRALLGVAAGAALSCGDPLVDESYSGVPRFTLEAKAVVPSEDFNAEHPRVDVGVFWSPGGASRQDKLVEQAGTVRRAEYYRPLRMHLFDEPGAELLHTLPSGARYGIARLGAYQDANGNGRREASEPFLGSSHKKALIRAPQPLSAQDSPTGAPLREGWHIVSTPLQCPGSEPTTSNPVADGECGVPLGAECKGDADCKGGVCILEFLGPWPNGACAIQEPPPNGCRQRGSVLLRSDKDPTKAYWLKGCQVSDDCGRLHPYQCDQQLRACRPTAEVIVEIEGGEVFPPFCRRMAPQP